MKKQLLLWAAILTWAGLTPISATAGGVFITGHDPDYHGFAGGNAVGAQHIIQRAIAYVTFTNPAPNILLVTDLRNPGGDQSDSRLGMVAAGFPIFDVADYGSGTLGVLDLHTVNFNNYDAVVVASDYGGWLRQDELDILNARSTDILNFINSGNRGLVAFAEAGNRAGGPPIYNGTTHDRFGYLPFIVSQLSLNQGESGFTVTQAGLDMGLTAGDINGNASHNVFTGTGGLDIIDQDPDQHILSLATHKDLSPLGICPSNMVVQPDPGLCSAVVTYTPPPAAFSQVVCLPPPGFAFPIGTTTVICTAFDNHTNQLSCSFTVTVNSEPPKLHCSDVTVCNDQGQCSAVVNYQVNTSNNCPGSITVVCTPPSGSTFPKGSTNVVCTATNSSGQTTSCSFTVTVRDCEPPTLNCGDITVCNDPGQCSAVVNYNVNASDNCPGVTVVCSPPSGAVFPGGTTPVNCAATDSSSNITSCTFNITVNDCEAPQAGCREALNPSGKKIPVAGKNPKSGQNPDGFYELLGKDNCDASSALSVFLIDGDTGFVFGPFAVGTILKITQSNHDTIQPMAGVVSWHIQLVGDAFVYAVDSSGNVGSSMACYVPPPPK